MFTSTFIVVLDACVLYPASLRDTLLRAMEAELFRAYWSHEIWREALRNLVANGMAAAQATRLDSMVRQSFPEAFVDGYEGLIDSLTNHPKDRHVLAVAIQAHAQVIVTADTRGFGADALAPYNIEAQTPDVFLTDLLDLAPDAIVSIIEQQAQALIRPPHSPGRVLDALARHAPRFAALARPRIEEVATPALAGVRRQGA